MRNFLNSLRNNVENGIVNISIPSQPADLYDPIKYMLALDAKRIRPILVLLGAAVFDPKSGDKAMPGALAIELFHNFTLIHDDMMDRAPLRRGMPTVHEKWNTDIGILSGDNLLIMAYQQLTNCDSVHIPPLLRVFNKMAQEVCEGQQLDMDFEKLPFVSEVDYIEMIRLKTSVLLGAALQMGAIIGAASETDAQLLYDFGVYVGLAYQLQDDILDVYGDPSKIGKSLGGDIVANKKTFLFVAAYKSATEQQRNELLRWFSLPGEVEEAAEKVQEVKRIYDQLGVLDQAVALKKKYSEKAFICLEGLTNSNRNVEDLRMLAQNLLNRER